MPAFFVQSCRSSPVGGRYNRAVWRVVRGSLSQRLERFHMSTAAPVSPPPSRGKQFLRHCLIALAVLVVMLVPMIVLLVITGQPAATYSAMGTLIGIVAVLAGGLRIGIITVIVAALLAPLAIVAGLSPLTGAALMAIMTLMVGRMSLFGLHKAVLLVPIFIAWPMIAPVPWLPLNALDRINELMAKHGMTLAGALDHMHHKAQSAATTAATPGPLKRIIGHALMEQRFDTHYLAWVLVVFLVGGLVPVLILPFALRKVHFPKPKMHPRSEALPYTITITVLTAVATYWFLDHPKQTAGAFLIATILVLTQVEGDIKWRLTIQRVVGTLAGVAGFVAVTSAINATTFTEVLGLPFPVRMYAVGLVFGAAAIVAKFSQRQWIYYILIVPAAASLNAFTFKEAADLGEQRLIDNVVGAVLVIAATLVALGASRLAAKRGASTPPPDASPV